MPPQMNVADLRMLTHFEIYSIKDYAGEHRRVAIQMQPGPDQCIENSTAVVALRETQHFLS